MVRQIYFKLFHDNVILNWGSLLNNKQSLNETWKLI